MQNSNYYNLLVFLFFLSLFFILLAFFYQIQPLLPYTGDDWRYLEYARSSIFPSMKEYNPARLFPEIIIPIWGLISAYIVTPVVGDYLQSFRLSMAMIMSFMITGLCAAFYIMSCAIFGNKTKCERNSNIRILSMFMTLLFVSVCFLYFKMSPVSRHIFHTETTTVAFYYIIPNILNSILVCMLISLHYKDDDCELSYLAWGIFLACIFFCQFSITFSSLISATYAGSHLLLRYVSQQGSLYQKALLLVKGRKNVDKACVFILLCWVVAAYYDIFGARFADLQSGVSFGIALDNLLKLSQGTHPYITTLLPLLGGGFGLLLFLRRKTQTQYLFLHVIVCALFSSALCFAADILINMRTDISLSRPEVAYNGFFLLILAAMLTAISIVKMYTPSILGFPLLVLFFVFTAIHSPKSFAQLATHDQYLRPIVTGWVEGIKKATSLGEKECIVYVPKIGWPFAPWLATSIPRTLYKHGQIPYEPKVRLQEREF